MGNFDWIFDVLTDIEDYANSKGFQQIANEVRKARNTVKKELSGQQKLSVSMTAEPLFKPKAQN